MSRRSGIFISAAISSTLLVCAGGDSAARDGALCSLLLPDLRPLDAAALDAENLHGLGLPAPALRGQLNDFGVILWDESNPRRPSTPTSPHTPTGQGSSTVSSSAR